MSQDFEVTLPKLGESILNATIVQWFKKEGDSVLLDEALLEVSTDKVNSEIPSPAAGVVKRILALPEQELQVGAPLLILERRAAGEARAGFPHPALFEQKGSGQKEELRGFFSPALLRMAKESGVEMEELERVPRSGGDGRVTKRDLEAYLAARAGSDGSQRIPLSPLRKAIAENLMRSYTQIPHAALVSLVDLTNILEFIHEKKELFFQKEGCKLTVTSFVIHALARTLRDYPLLNASLEGQTLVVKRSVNLGVAVSVEDGLLVPVIKKCQEKTIPEIARALRDLSSRAREGKLLLEEVKEGTITFSNFGMSGMTLGLPIIRYPEAAILGMGGIEKRVVVLDNDRTAIRSLVHLSLSFDHRVVDGMYASHFLSALKKDLEHPSFYGLC